MAVRSADPSPELEVVGQGGAILLLGVSHGLPLAMLALFLRGASITAVGVVWEATLHERVPDEALGRVANVDGPAREHRAAAGRSPAGGTRSDGTGAELQHPDLRGVAVVLAALALTAWAVRELG